MSKHTPGPWTYEINPDCTEFRVRAQEDDVLGGCGCCGSPWCGEEDARLIAAAPELLEALKLAIHSHGKLLLSDPPQDPWKLYQVEEKARAAIKKAEGNT